jgi:prepilin-type N-terminal cleavage/methylation domain-containing protein
MSRRAFTLVELLVVIAIIGLLSTIAIMNMSSSRAKAKIASQQQYDANIFQGLGDRLIGDWGLDNASGTSIVDNSGNGNNGTLGGTVNGSTYVAGVIGGAIYFDGSTNYIQLASPLSVPLNSFTASAWFKTTITNFSYILSAGEVAGTGHIIGTGTNGQLRVCLGVSGCITGTRSYNDGVWHFATVTGDGTSIRGYIDGVQETTSTAMASTVNSTFSIGADNSGYIYKFQGTLDQVRLYSGALTARAIKERYLAGLSLHPQALAAIITP